MKAVAVAAAAAATRNAMHATPPLTALHDPWHTTAHTSRGNLLNLGG